MKVKNYIKENTFDAIIIISSLFYCLITTYLLFEWVSNSSFTVSNNDDYLTNFKIYLKTGFYQSNIQGTTVIYFFVLRLIYDIVGSVQLSFLLLNGFSQLFLFFFGVFMLSKIKPKINNILYYVILLMFCFRTLTLTAYNKASNDTFLGVFIMLVLYLLIFKICPIKIIEKKNLILLGAFLAICFGIRPTTVLLIPVVLLLLFLQQKLNKLSFVFVLKNTSMVLGVFFLLTSIIHFPSIIEKRKLSFYNKNPKEYNWTQRNFLAIQNIQNNNETFNSGNVWKTKFKDVEEYIELYGEDSLPKSLSEVVLKHPFLYLKVVFLNGIGVFSYIVRYTGLLFLIPMISLIYNKKYFVENIPLLSFVVFSICLLSIVFTRIEYRWYSGYEILIYLSILLSINQIYKKQNKLVKIIALVSVIIVGAFNLRSIVNM